MEAGELAGIENPRIDFQILLAWVLHARREDLIREPLRALTHREEVIFRKAAQLRLLRRPVPYITGEKWFYGRLFKVNRAVLIPRPETEMLVEFGKDKIGDLHQDSTSVADIGTGSGCIAVSIACEIQGALVCATDISPLALKLADKNVKRYAIRESCVIKAGRPAGRTRR